MIDQERKKNLEQLRIQSKTEELKREEDKNIILQPFEGFIVTDEQLVTALEKHIEDVDADELARIGGEALGGKCWYLNDGTYSFEPDENYYGAFDLIKETKTKKFPLKVSQLS